MTVLVTGASGYVGAALVPRLQRAGMDVRAFARDPGRVAAAGVTGVPVVVGDAVSGAGLAEALDGVEVAYFLIHSMEAAAGGGGFEARDRVAAARFAAAARAAGVRRVVYLGGLVPTQGPASAHLASRLEVERTLLQAAPEALALRASIVIGARSRSFRFLVRLVERVPVMPLPSWREHRTRPIDGRDVLAFLVAGATSDAVDGPVSLDIAGPDTVTYGELITRIRDALLVGRAPIPLGFSLTPIASRVAAAIAGEDHALIGPLMEGLDGDLLPRDDRAAPTLGVRLHRLNAAIERALRDWEAVEELRAR
ncbi:NAD-dependent epimerase/dehydratase family protein [Baekduia soli]|uniref:NAD-dependent epimerase/dehydratase family protein n=1 Tax=Baekduia soli TaxID=496014 RepID=A0A5B8U3B4_9ACTN|nr:NAD(P)H-binding protein [Baekduia soli]QEC47470.1 NAD-dependent epimerase/dehydratase family protein [Baekduia soli]